VARILRVSVKALEHMRRRGAGPSPVRIGVRGVRYTSRAVEVWINKKEGEG